jgi:hypothetical protein
MSIVLWRLARIENALAQRGLLEPFPVPFFRVLLSPDRRYFERSSGSDPKLKDFVNRTLPTLKDHLREAKEIEHAVSVNKM